MNDWPVVNLGMFADFRNGLNFSKEGPADPVYIVGVGDFQDKSSLEGVSCLSQIRPDGPLADEDLIRDGDFLFVRSNGNKALIGRCVYITGLNGTRVTFSGFTIRARLRNSELHPGFAKHALRSDLFKAHLHELGGGSNISNLNQDILSSFEFHLPSLPDQIRITAILDEWENAIKTAEKLLDANRDRKDAVRHVLFCGYHRLGNYRGDWSPTPVSDVLRIRQETSGGDETVYSVSVSRGLVDQVKHLGRSFSAASTDNYNRVCFGDIVYTKSPTGSFPLGIVKQSYIVDDVIVSPLYGVYVPKSVAHGRLIDLYFSSPSAAEKYLAPFVHRGAKNTMAITDEGFLAGEIPMPPTQEEADATGELIEALNNEIGRLEDYCGHLRLQKRGLMQKLLSGEWPVPASIDRLLPGELCIDKAVGAEAKRAEATG